MFIDVAQPGDLNMNCEFIGGIRVWVGLRERGRGGRGDVKRSEWETRENSRNEEVSRDKSDLSEQLLKLLP